MMNRTEPASGALPRFRDYDYSDFYFGRGSDFSGLFQHFHAWYQDALPCGYDLYAQPLQTAPSSRVRVQQRRTGAVAELLNLASYNYLGISYRDEVKAAAMAAVQAYGLGASGSPILSGTFEVHEELAQRLARFKKKEGAVLFPSGYSANVGFISALMRPADHILLDQYAHASIVDGAILAKSTTTFFRHNSAADLERKIARAQGRKLVVVEGVYSMDGDLCALPEIVSVAKRHGAQVLIDEAHSTFVYGADGRGVAEHFGLEDEVDFHLGTFSKSLGGQGGFVCGSAEMANYVTAFARSRFFSCNLSPVLAAGILAGLGIVEREPELRSRLWANVAFLRSRLGALGIDTGSSTSQVVPVMVHDDARVFQVAHDLRERGLFVQPVTYPAVPKHRSRLRISVSAAHAERDLAFAADTIADVLKGGAQ